MGFALTHLEKGAIYGVILALGIMQCFPSFTRNLLHPPPPIFSFSSSSSSPATLKAAFEQRAASSKTPPNFLAWAEGFGIDTSAVKFGQNKLGNHSIRGLQAARDIEANTFFLLMPLNKTFTVYVVNTDPVLRKVLGKDSVYFNEVVPEILAGDTMEWHIDELLLPIAILYHASLGHDSPYSGYIDMLMSTDLSNDGTFLGEADVAERYPDMIDAQGWQKENWAYEEFYFKYTRRSRAHLETNHPDLFGPHVLVGGEPILSDMNLIWASRIQISRQWSGDDISHDDLHGDNGSARLMIPVADLTNHQNSCVSCGSHWDWVLVDGETNKWMESEEEVKFGCFAECEIKEGEDIVFPYTKLEHRQCYETGLRNWGFVDTTLMTSCIGGNEEREGEE